MAFQLSLFHQKTTYSTLSLWTDFTRSKFKQIYLLRVLPSRMCSHKVSEEHTASIIICSACLAQYSSLKLKEYVPPRHPWTSTTLHGTGITSQKIVLFTATDVRTSIPTFGFIYCGCDCHTFSIQLSADATTSFSSERADVTVMLKQEQKRHYWHNTNKAVTWAEH
jgi:hypothetical protein